VRKTLFLSSAALALTASLGIGAACAIDAEANVEAGVEATVGESGGSATASTTTAANTEAGNVSAAAAATATGRFTVDDIDANLPFGQIPVDPTQTPEQLTAGLSDDQRLELQERCGVIIANPDHYQVETMEWCTTYLDWRKMQPAN
jgi:hypothetical protein